MANRRQKIIEIHRDEPGLGIKEIAEMVNVSTSFAGQVTTAYWLEKMKNKK